MDRAALATLLLLGGLGVTILVAWGAQAFLTYLLFAAVAVAIAVGLRVGGGWFEDASRGRFRSHGRDS